MIPLAAAVAVLMHVVMVLGRRVAAAAAPRPILVAVAAGVLTGALAGLFALVTGRSPVEVLGSGQQSLPGLVDQTWPVGVLLLLLLCKGVAYGLCLGSFRGGPTFPAIFLGGVLGVLAGHLPGLGTVPGLGICMAAGMVAILRLPVTSVLLIVLLLGPAATSQMPVVMIATVTALVVVETLDRRRAPTGGPTRPRPGSPRRPTPRPAEGGAGGDWPAAARRGPATPDVEDLDGAPRPVRARPRAAAPPDLPGLQRHDAGGPVGAARRCCPRWSATSATRPRRTPSVTRRAGRSGWRGPGWPPSSAPHRTRSSSPPAARSPTRWPSRARSARRSRGSRNCRHTSSPRPRSTRRCWPPAPTLERDYGVAVTYLPVDRDGLVDPAAVEAALRPETVLVSLMAANNETGTLQPVREVGAITRARGVLLHVDAAQAAGKVEVDVAVRGAPTC